MQKFFIIITILFLASSCHRNTISKTNLSGKKLKLTSTCPKIGECTLVLIKNKSLDTLYFNNALIYKIVENSTTDVVKYEYTKNMEQSEYDGGYREEIVFEIPHGDFEKKLTDNELLSTKMLFGRHCFCRGQNGLFKVVKGQFIISSRAKQLHFDLNFKINEVPQVSNTISH